MMPQTCNCLIAEYKSKSHYAFFEELKKKKECSKLRNLTKIALALSKHQTVANFFCQTQLVIIF